MGITLQEMVAEAPPEERKPRFEEVKPGPELLRIRGLQRRPIPDAQSPEAAELARFLTSRMAKVQAPYPGTLTPTQALALQEAFAQYQVPRMGGVFSVVVGGGKAQPHSEPVLLERGWTPMGEVRPGDRIYGSDGRLHDVLAVHPQGVRDIYRVTFSDGSYARCDGDHLWTFRVNRSLRTRTAKEWQTERLTRKCGAHRANRLFLPMVAPVQYQEAELPIDPYTLGLLLGDGSLTHGLQFTSMDPELVDSLVLPPGVRRVPRSSKTCGRAESYRLTAERCDRRNGLLDALRDLGLHGLDSYEKFIPEPYLRGSVEQRLSLLQGLFDTDGHAHGGAVDYLTASVRLSSQVRELVESLGGTCVTSCKRMLWRGAEKTYQRSYIKLPLGLPAFRLGRKLAGASVPQHGPTRAVVSIEPDGRELASCISVSASDSLYVTRHYVLTHNTLLCRLMIEVVRAQRPLYICPSANVKAATKEFRKLESFWHVRPTNQLMIESYEMLAHTNSGEDLDDKGNVIRLSKIEMLQPTDVFLDEAHKGAGDGTGASRIVALAEKYPHIRFWLFTGTLFTESIKPPSKLMWLALRERSPLPYDYLEREMWAQHLDARANAGAKVGAGALMDFLTPDEVKRYNSIYAGDHADRLTVVRQGVSRWVYETPGVFGTETPILDTPLTVEAYYPPAEDDAVEEAFCKLLGDGTAENPGWILPDGEQIIDGLQFSAYAFDYGQGYFRTNDPPPPPKYRLHRLSWARWCRRALKYNKRGIDSEARMQKEVRKGLYNDKWTEDELRALLYLEFDKPIPASHQYMLGRSRLELWEEAKRDYFTATGKREPPVRAEWISDEAIEAVGVWCNEHPRGVVWVNSIPLGEQLARVLRLPYYGAKGLDARKRNIEAHALGTPAIASVKANGTGKNLQRIFQDNLWLTPPGEQAMGRTHRQGTDAAVVRNYVYLGCAHHLKAYLSAESVKARFTEEMQFGSRLKIRYAETCMPDFWELEQRGGRRYEVPDKEQC